LTRCGSGTSPRAGVAVAILSTLAIVVACGPSTASPTGSSAQNAPPASQQSRSTTPSSAASSRAVAVDPSLLSILPDEVGGAPLDPSPETAAGIAKDPALAIAVEALAIGLAVSSGSSTDQDLVIASVVRLRPDIFNEAFFRSWRHRYDDAACAQGGGVAGNAETEIDDRKVFIGSCANGAFTYHTRYGEDVLVSLTSVGKARFGEQVMSNLGD
jgi:hypothetical protein